MQTEDLVVNLMRAVDAYASDYGTSGAGKQAPSRGLVERSLRTVLERHAECCKNEVTKPATH